MGCFHSKKEISDLHPNIFRLININENGVDLCSGQLEITDSDIILYREGRDSTVWPLHSLRRYGFEGEIFSFESGRRCETGEGIYAFKCRRASELFHTLQQQIQLRNVIHDSVSYPASRLTPSPQGRQTLQASVVHRSSIDNGQSETIGTNYNSNSSNTASNSTVIRAANQSPRSPSSGDILEVMPLHPRPQTGKNHVTNVYQLRDFKREHNNNQDPASDCRHIYSNDLCRDLAVLRNTLRQETALNNIRDIEDETRYLENRYISDKIAENTINTVLSPTLSSSSEHYAQLSIDQQELQTARLYVNVTSNDNNILDSEKSEVVPTTPLMPQQIDLTPKLVEYCNLVVNNKPEINSYANLMLGDIVDSSKNVIPALHLTNTDQNQKFSESDTFTSISPVEELEVNYAVLDIDCSKDNSKILRDLTSPESQSFSSSKNESSASYSSQTHGRLVSQNSVDKMQLINSLSSAAPSSIGYTTIDFDKTVALTSVASCDVSLDGTRKTRHNSSNICGSPSSTEKIYNLKASLRALYI